MRQKTWHCYLALCSDGSYYCGITTDLKRREHEHNNTKKGAKYTRAHRPVKVNWSIKCKNHSFALKVESQIKKLKRADKERIVISGAPWEKKDTK